MLGATQKVLKSDGSTDSIAIAGVVTVYTHSFPLFSANYFGLWILPSSVTGTANLKIELEESWTEPTTEGSSDANWVEPEGFDDVFSAVNDDLAHVKTIAPVPMSFGRYKITGLAGNPADALISMYNFLQEAR